MGAVGEGRLPPCSLSDWGLAGVEAPAGQALQGRPLCGRVPRGREKHARWEFADGVFIDCGADSAEEVQGPVK